MKTSLILGTALVLVATASRAEEITVMSWGGTYSQSQVEAYQKPFTAETGITVISVDSDNPAIPVKAQVEAENVTTDVVDIEYADAIRLCDEGLLEEIDPAILPPAPDGTPATEDYLPQALHECATAIMVWSTVIAYNTEAFPDGAPTTVADFFDTEKFPGKRLAYNCSPSFNWKKNLDDDTIAKFQRELGAMGYTFQFSTLAGFHALNLSMFDLAKGYNERQMSAYVELQEREFADEARGYTATKHQREVGTGYFDAVSTAINPDSSTVALAGSTESGQFH